MDLRALCFASYGGSITLIEVGHTCMMQMIVIVKNMGTFVIDIDFIDELIINI